MLDENATKLNPNFVHIGMNFFMEVLPFILPMAPWLGFVSLSRLHFMQFYLRVLGVPRGSIPDL